MTPDEITSLFLADVSNWYESKRNRNGTVNTNVMTVGLMITDHMATAFPLAKADYQAESQVKGLSGQRIKNILARCGEHRHFTSEGGRTSRSSLFLAVQLADLLAASLGAAAYLAASPQDQEQVRYQLQAWFAGRVQQDYFGRQRIKADLDPGKPTRQAIAELLTSARKRGGNAAGAVAQHLVGAKLSLRFPDLEISNDSYTTADQQTNRPGDFKVGDTAFHVTMSPGENLMSNRCTDNLRNGFRVLVLVPEDVVEAAAQLAKVAGISDKIAVSDIESFVGTNIEEIAVFGSAGIRTGLRALLERYNERVHAVEPDPSLQIEIPANL